MKNLSVRFVILSFLILNFALLTRAQQKVLFDATKAETAGNADWVIDADIHNLGFSNGIPVAGASNESNPQQYPTPAQSTVTASTKPSYWQGALSSWGIDLVKKGFEVETLPYDGKITFHDPNNPQDLSNYSVFVVDEPNNAFTAVEKTAILEFVKAGGGLFMISDHNISDRNHSGIDSPHVWNDLMQNNSVQADPFGFSFDYLKFDNKTENIPDLPGDPLLHGPMGDVTRVEFYGGTSMTLNPTDNPTVKGVVYHTGSAFGNRNVLVAYAEFGKGKVVAMGDSSPADDGSGDPGDKLYDGWIEDASGNHERLIMNGSIWLSEGQATAVQNIVLPEKLINLKNLQGSIAVSLRNNRDYPDNHLEIYNLSGQMVESVSNLKPQLNYAVQLPSKGIFIYRFRDFRQTLDWGKFYF